MGPFWLVCAHAWKPERITPKYYTQLSSGRWDYKWLLFIPFYSSVSSEFFKLSICYFYHRGEKVIFFPKKKVNRACAMWKAQQRTHGEQDVATGLQKLIAWLTEWERRLVCTNILGRSWVHLDHYSITIKGSLWNILTCLTPKQTRVLILDMPSSWNGPSFCWLPSL